MAGVYELEYKGKAIFCMDISGLQSKDIQEFYKHVNHAEEMIRKHPPKSLLVITEVTNTGFDTAVAGIIKDYAQHNTPYVKASAVVGIVGWSKIILTAIKTATGRDFYLADTMEDAKEWLVKQ
ncbi:MAG: STAS/SEC14 domain-containing protein [Bacteroidota bacterium]